MSTENPRRHLDGVTLETILTELVDEFGWVTLGDLVRINCFRSDPSIKSSLKFLRKTLWAREQVETVYIGFREGESAGKIRQRLKQKSQPSAKKSAPSGNRAGSGSRTSAAKTSGAKPSATDPWAKAKKGSDQ